MSPVTLSEAEGGMGLNTQKADYHYSSRLFSVKYKTNLKITPAKTALKRPFSSTLAATLRNGSATIRI